MKQESQGEKTFVQCTRCLAEIPATTYPNGTYEDEFCPNVV